MSANVSQYFYEGSTENLSFSTFMGTRWSIGVSIKVGPSAGVSYSRSEDKFFKVTHSLSSNVGTGISVTAIGFIATYGGTWVNP